MSLPNPSMAFFPFDPLPASQLNDMVENVEALADGSGLDDDAITPAKLALVNYQTDNSNSIANVTNGDITIQVGWGQLVGNGTTNIAETVTFPVAFTTVLGVNPAMLGAVVTTPATTIGGLTTEYGGGGFLVTASDITTTTFLISLGRAASTFSASVYHGYSWIAWGII